MILESSCLTLDSYFELMNYFVRLGCLFLAGKIEESFLAVKDCRLVLKTLTEEALFNAEIKILEVNVLVCTILFTIASGLRV